MGKYCANGRTQVKLISSYEDVLLKLNVMVPGQYSFELGLQMERTACGDSDFLLEPNQILNISFPAGGLSSYEPNTHCTWVIPLSEDVEIDVKRIQLPSVSQVTGKCTDYLHIQTPFYSRFFCGSLNDTQIVVSPFIDNYLKLTFHSADDVKQFGGFELGITYNKLCNRTYTTLSKEIKLNDISLLSVNCSFDIRVPADYNLNLYISSINFGYSEESSNFIRFIDLNSNQTLLNFTQNLYSDKALQWSTNAVRIESSKLAYLSMFYMSSNRSLPNGCGGVMLASQGDFINPPYNDRNYSDCTWDVSVPPGNQLVVNFYSFNMGSLVNCPLDNVKIYTTPQDRPPKLVATYCGEKVLEPITLRDNRILVIAKKSPNFDGEGFRLNFKMHENYSNRLQPKPPPEFV